MRRSIICLAILLVFSVTGSYAHGPGGAGHGPQTEITEIQASEQATRMVTIMVERGKLGASWAETGLARYIRSTSLSENQYEPKLNAVDSTSATTMPVCPPIRKPLARASPVISPSNRAVLM